MTRRNTACLRPGETLCTLGGALHVSQNTNAPTPPPTTRGGVFVDRDEVAMPRSDKPLPDQITAAATELKLARRDGSAEWISKAAKELDELLDKIPRAAQRQEST